MLKSGEILSHYKIVSAIGVGGMGEVYLAEDTKLGRQVALKVLISEVSGDKDRVARFVQEAKAASALNHPNILTIYEIGNFEGSNYMATELIKGATLRDRMRSEPLKLLESLDVAIQITAALGAAHEAGIIHRDVKPENIMIRDDGLVKVLDFGLAKLLPVSAASIETTLHQHKTKPGMLVGTVAYMSPEQARGRTIDPRSDIFSLGIVLFEILTGKRPFEGESHLDLISSILKDEPPPLRLISPDLPRQLERIVDKTLRKDRDHRYQHIKDLNIDIEDLRDELKFEAKLNNSVHPTVEAQIHETNQDSLLNTQSNLRSALTTGISKTRRFTLLHALIFVLIAVGVVGAIWYLRPETNSAVLAGTYKATEVASWNAVPGELFGAASFSPDGKLIAFSSTKSGSKGIWITQTTSTEAIQVTNDIFSNTDPIWSPRGDEIAYLSGRPNAAGGTSTGVWRVGALGGTPRSITPNIDGSGTLRLWTQSGRIYYDVKGDLYAIDISSGAGQRITSLGRPETRWISISPDERTIAYAIQNDEQWQIFTSDVAGTKPVEAAKGEGQLSPHVAWVQDKNRLFYTAVINGSPQIRMTIPGSGREVRIASPEGESSVVAASPDGRSIILSSAKEESNLWRAALGETQESPLVRDLNAKLWPSVSPDSERIAFQSIKNLSAGDKLRSGNIIVKSIKQGGENDRQTVLAENGFLPVWSPDGSAIAFLRVTGNVTELFSINPNGGGEKRLATGDISSVGYSVSPYNLVLSSAYSWSPDSSKIAFVAERNGTSNIWAVSTNGGDQPLTTNTETGITYYCPIWAADGRRIAFSYQRKGRDEAGKTIRGIRIADAETGAMSDVFETNRIIRLIGWTPDDNGIIISEASKDFSGLPPVTNLSRLAVTGGAETSISSLKNVYFYNILLSKDRKQIAYAARDQNMDNLWVIPTLGGTPRKLSSNNDSGQYFSRLAWLPDGSAIVFGKQTRFSLLSLVTDID